MAGLWLERELDSLSRFEGATEDELAARSFPALREAVEHVIAAAERLGGTGDPVVQQAASLLGLVPGVRIGDDGRVLEWHRDDLAEVEPHHRHVSHLGFLYPGEQATSPAEEAAAERSLLARGDEATGWSLVWKACLWARLGRPERVQALLELYLRPAEREGERDRSGLYRTGLYRTGLYPSLFSEHPPFRIDGNFGIVAALAECLVQSHRGEIALLPALPAAMADGTVRGLRARPGIAVDMTWSEGAVTVLALRALGPGALGVHRVRHGNCALEVELTDLAPVRVDLAALAA